jgi:hypothetical protein
MTLFVNSSSINQLGGPGCSSMVALFYVWIHFKDAIDVFE